MLVRLPAMGDFLDSDIKLNDDSLAATPDWAKSPSTAPPVSPGQGNTGANPATSSSSWSDLGRTLVSGLVQGLVSPRPAAPKPPSLLSTSSSGISTGVIVAGVGVAVVVGVLLLRGRSA